MTTEAAGANAAGLGLFGPLETTAEMAEATADATWIQNLLDFLGALALAEAEVGLVPTEAAREIRRAATAEGLEPEQLGRESRASGTPVLPLVQALEGRLPEGVRDFVHWGATSQDAIDTALMLVLARALPLIQSDMRRAELAAAALARRHRRTLQAARTLLQQAVPTTFGLRAAQWLVELKESHDELARVQESCLALQLGGAGGTLAALGEQGLRVQELMAAQLRLHPPTLPWHTNRIRTARLAAALGLVVGAAAKVAQDVVLLSQTEVAEVREGTAGAGGSSAMPQKHNPARSVGIVARQHRAVAMVSLVLSAMPQPLERAAGEWQAEWASFSELLRLAGGAASEVALLLEGLEVDPTRMRANLALTRGAVMSERLALRLAAGRGRAGARALVTEALSRSAQAGTDLQAELAQVPGLEGELRGETLDDLFSPEGYLGSSERLIDRALTAVGE
ncbi:MAG: lyase family protein [Candidatus Dormibacteria bacterium]